MAHVLYLRVFTLQILNRLCLSLFLHWAGLHQMLLTAQRPALPYSVLDMANGAAIAL